MWRLAGPGRSPPNPNGDAMSSENAIEHIDIVVIGAGQAGLSAGYHLAKRGLTFLILDADERIGDHWRQRWDSLKLYSPREVRLPPGHAVPGAVGPLADRVARWPTTSRPTRATSTCPSAAASRVERVEPRRWRLRRVDRPAAGASRPARSSSPPARSASRTSRRSPVTWTRRSASSTPTSTATRPNSATGPVLVVGLSHSGRRHRLRGRRLPDTGRSCRAGPTARCRSRSPTRNGPCSAGRSSSSCSDTS